VAARWCPQAGINVDTCWLCCAVLPCRWRSCCAVPRPRCQCREGQQLWVGFILMIQRERGREQHQAKVAELNPARDRKLCSVMFAKQCLLGKAAD
jgi:hypothetical protein